MISYDYYVAIFTWVNRLDYSPLSRCLLTMLDKEDQKSTRIDDDSTSSTVSLSDFGIILYEANSQLH